MTKACPVVCAVMLVIVAHQSLAKEFQNGIKWDTPPKVDPGQDAHDPPSDAIVLFDGTNLDAWNNGDQWTVEDGVATVGRGGISTKQEFGDCQLHIEWSSPDPPTGEGQGCGNSGVYIMGRYEVQVLDSYSSDTYHDGQAGAVYKQSPPAVNATRKPGEWNTYDIFWTCPRFDNSGKLVSPAYITVAHNGVLILNHFELKGETPFDRVPRYRAHPPKGPIVLQDHHNPVQFRNIWVREFKPAQGIRVREPHFRVGDKDIPVKYVQIEGKWLLKQVGDQQVEPSDEPIQLIITYDGDVSGYTGVNRMSGTLTDGDRLFGPIATTRRAGSPEAMQLEVDFTRSLSEANAFEVEGATLRLFAGDELLLVFDRAEE